MASKVKWKVYYVHEDPKPRDPYQTYCVLYRYTDGSDKKLGGGITAAALSMDGAQAVADAMNLAESIRRFPQAGFRGIHYDSFHLKWMIDNPHRQYTIGTFDSLAEALDAELNWPDIPWNERDPETHMAKQTLI